MFIDFTGAAHIPDVLEAMEYAHTRLMGAGHGAGIGTGIGSPLGWEREGRTIYDGAGPVGLHISPIVTGQERGVRLEFSFD